MGCIYKRSWKDKKTGEIVEGDTLWIKYYRNGKAYHESTHSDKENDAKRLLKKREGEIAKGEIPGIYFDKVRFNELAEDFLTDYRINDKKTLPDAERHVKNLKTAFDGIRVTEITTAKIKDYVNKRMEEGLSNASINRELSAFKRIFHLASRCTPPKIGHVPYIPMLKESNIRKGFFEHEEYLALKDALPFYLKPVVTFAYHTGWRLREILNLTWNKIDMRQGIIRLDPGETKNEEARTIYLEGELMKEMKILHGKRNLGCLYVFHHDGKQIKRFTRSWRTACIKAGLYESLKDDNGNVIKVPTRIFHDFRRTGVRNMIRAGVHERVAMKISGHKTRSVFDRYNIVSGEDLKEAAHKQEVYINSQAAGYSLVTVKPKIVNLKK
jgi:integrase